MNHTTTLKRIKYVLGVIESKNLLSSGNLILSYDDFLEIDYRDWRAILTKLSTDGLLDLDWQDEIAIHPIAGEYNSGYQYAFAKLNKKISDYLQNDLNRLMQIDWFSRQTGSGCVKGKSFKLQKDKSQFKIFSQIAERKRISREELLAILSFDEETHNDKKANNIEITKYLKRLRISVGLNTKELINNGGNLILLLDVSILD